MTEISEKVRLLRERGYRYNFMREIYVNVEARKIFVQEAIEDHDVEWLKDRLDEVNNSGDWCFYFDGDPPSPAVKAEIVSELK